jgi:hypothetical protein
MPISVPPAALSVLSVIQKLLLQPKLHQLLPFPVGGP